MEHVETNREIYLQERNEERFNRKHIDVKIRTEIEANPLMQAKLQESIVAVQAYMDKTYTYTTKTGEVRTFESKMRRIAQLKTMDISVMIMDLFVGIAYFMREELFTSVTSQLAARLKFNDRSEAIMTVAELCAVLCHVDVCDIHKASAHASLTLSSRIPLSNQLVEFVENSQYLPPMVCEPLPLTHNFSSGYLTHNDSLILGSGNHHDGDLCLDVLNTMSRVPLSLNTEFLSEVEEEPTYELDTQAKIDHWMSFKRQSYYFYSLMVQHGNRFYLNHKVDKRLRIYASGYHINTQGASFKKAMIEFADKELVEGVPT
jgi:hypothetical protein